MTKASSRLGSDAWQHGVLRSWLGTTPTWGVQLELLRMADLEPTPAQAMVLQSRLPNGKRARKTLVTGAIQVGKSMLTAMDALMHLPWLGGLPLMLIAPDYGQAVPEATYLAEWLERLEWLGHYSMPKGGSDPWVLETIFGSTIKTYSATNPVKIAGVAPGWVGLCESGQVSLEAYHQARVRCIPKNARFLINGTLEGATNWYARLARRWRSPNPEGGVAYVLPAWANPHFYPGGAQDPKILEAKAELPAEVFKARFAGEPTAPSGLVFPDFDPEVHVRPIYVGPQPDGSHDRAFAVLLPADVPIELAIDPGFGGSAYAVLAVARQGRQFYVVDELYERGYPGTYMIRKAQERWWWPRWLASGAVAVLDQAAKTHNTGSTSQVELWSAPPRDGGAGAHCITNYVYQEDGQQRLHKALELDPLTGQPQVLVDPACLHLIEELCEGYRRPTDGQGTVLRDDPIDKYCDAIKALWYLLYARLGATGRSVSDGYGVTAGSLSTWH